MQISQERVSNLKGRAVLLHKALIKRLLSLLTARKHQRLRGQLKGLRRLMKIGPMALAVVAREASAENATFNDYPHLNSS